MGAHAGVIAVCNVIFPLPTYLVAFWGYSRSSREVTEILTFWPEISDRIFGSRALSFNDHVSRRFVM